MRTIFRNIISILDMFLLISFNQTTTFQLTLQMDMLYQESSCTGSCTSSLSHVPWHYQLKKSQWVEQPVRVCVLFLSMTPN